MAGSKAETGSYFGQVLGSCYRSHQRCHVCGHVKVMSCCEDGEKLNKQFKLMQELSVQCQIFKKGTESLTCHRTGAPCTQRSL